MKIVKLSVVLLALTAFTCGATNQTGVARFRGSIAAPASASMTLIAGTSDKGIQQRKVELLSDARQSLHSDVLDYFAGYAPKAAALVSVSYR